MDDTTTKSPRRFLSQPVAAALGLVAAGSMLLAACGGDSTPTTAPSTPRATSTASATSTSSATSTASATDTAAGRVSANNASVEELTAAFEAAGISNAGKWANEVEEYRPYDESDPNMSKLRDELAKYNPADGVVDAIVNTLSLP